MADLFPLVSRPRGDDGKRISMHEIACSRCKAVDTLVANRSRYPEEHVRGTFQQRGWRISNSGAHVCPGCVREEARANAAARAAYQQERDMAKAPKADIVTEVAGMMRAEDAKGAAKAALAGASAVVPSPDASKAITAMYMLLEDAYLHARRAYKDGWDDARVAKEAGVSPVLVAESRERHFGPLVRDTTLEDLRAEAKALGNLHGVMRQHLLETQAKLMDVDGRFADIQKIMTRIGELHARIVSVEVREDKAGAP